MNLGLRAAVPLLLATVVMLLTTACSKKKEPTHAPSAPTPPPQQVESSVENRRYEQAAEPFIQAIAKRNYAAAYELLSRAARARMSLNQFVAPPDALAFQRNEQSLFMNVTPGDFAELMKKVEELYGLPQSVKSLAVFTKDPDILNRRNPDESKLLDSADAIGAMPDSIPSDVCRASIHCQIATALTPEQRAHAAAEVNREPDELQSDPNFNPACNLKVVLVEEDEQIRVGYFEFFPPSRWN